MICLDMLGYAGIYVDMSEYVLICSNIFRVWGCIDLFGFVWIFQICSNVSKLILTYLTYPNVSKHIQIYLNISECI